MGLTPKSRAHLVRLLAVLPATEWEGAAATVGFVPEPEAVGVPREPPPGKGGVGEKPTRPRPPPEPYSPADLPDPPFWRVAAQVILPPDRGSDATPPWLMEAQPWAEQPESDRSLPPPRQSLLVPPARQARFLRRQLVEQRGAGTLDVVRLCGLLAQRRLPRRLPQLPRGRWPARVHLLIDHSQALRPYWDDFWQVEELPGAPSAIACRLGSPAQATPRMLSGVPQASRIPFPSGMVR